jgi:hypothetical protein
MDFQLLFNIACTITGTIAGWLFKVLWDTVQDLKEDIKEIERGYVQKDDYRIDIADIKGMLGRIFDRLDRQADNK